MPRKDTVAPPACRHCRGRPAFARGLCWTCGADAAVRALYPRHRRRPAAGPALLCVNCGIWRQAKGSRGLCRRCHKDAAVREATPPRPGGTVPTPKEHPGAGADWSAERVEALIAEQLAKPLPDWWARHERHQLARDRGTAADRLLYAVRRLQRRA